MDDRRMRQSVPDYCALCHRLMVGGRHPVGEWCAVDGSAEVFRSVRPGFAPPDCYGCFDAIEGPHTCSNADRIRLICSACSGDVDANADHECETRRVQCGGCGSFQVERQCCGEHFCWTCAEEHRFLQTRYNTLSAAIRRDCAMAIGAANASDRPSTRDYADEMARVTRE